MVVYPHHADRGEAGQKCEIRAPEMKQRVAQSAGRDFLRQSDLQDKQRHGDGEYAVAKGLEAGRFFGLFGRAGHANHQSTERPISSTVGRPRRAIAVSNSSRRMRITLDTPSAPPTTRPWT